jgi:hypothetical protein
MKGATMKLKIKTVFDEEIEVGDKIMYIYKGSGITRVCFGEVLEIEYKELACYREKQPHLHVRKTYELINGTRHKCDVKVILTSPTAFKCNQLLPFLE